MEDNQVFINEESNKTGIKEPRYTLEMTIPEKAYTKVTMDKATTVFYAIRVIIDALIFIMTVILYVTDMFGFKTVYFGIFVFFIVYLCLIYIATPVKRKKLFKQIEERRENEVTYSFFDEEMKYKSPSAELTLQYEDAEYYAENDEFLIVAFKLKRNLAVEKSQCSPELLDFIRNMVSAEKQKKAERKYLFKVIRKDVLELLLVIIMCVLLVLNLYEMLFVG